MGNSQRLRTFSGQADSEDIGHWIRHCNMVASAHGWEERPKLFNACASLIGPASYWLDCTLVSDWQEFCTKITSRFEEDTNSLIRKLHNCKQIKNASVREYIDNFQQLSARIATTNIQLPPALELRQFMKGSRAEFGTR